MRAILVKAPGDVSQLYIGEVERPVPGPQELLVRVKATALNRADLLQRRGLYPPPPGESEILGLEMAGIVEETGPRCSRFRTGDRVFGLLAGGGYAEYVTLHEKMAMPIPPNLDFPRAAAIPEAFLTAYQALFWLGGLQPGHTVLIHAGASGVGTAAIQLTREAGAKAIVTAGSEAKLKACRELGAMAGINYRSGPFAPEVLKLTGHAGVNIILDFVGAPYLEQNLRCLATDGRIIVLSLLGGRVADNFDLRPLMQKRARIEGSTLRNRPLDYKIRLTEAFSQYALPRLADGRLKPVVDKIFNWEDVARAHEYMEANKNIGKIVLTLT